MANTDMKKTVRGMRLKFTGYFHIPGVHEKNLFTNRNEYDFMLFSFHVMTIHYLVIPCLSLSYCIARAVLYS